jgi:hypothetical protein
MVSRMSMDSVKRVPGSPKITGPASAASGAASVLRLNR